MNEEEYNNTMRFMDNLDVFTKENIEEIKDILVEMDILIDTALMAQTAFRALYPALSLEMEKTVLRYMFVAGYAKAQGTNIDIDSIWKKALEEIDEEE